MPRGRPTNLDKKIAHHIDQLRRALVAREHARIEGQVAVQMAGIVEQLGNGAVGNAGAAPSKPAARPTKKRKGWSPAAKAAARERMLARWAARKGKAGQRCGGPRGGDGEGVGQPVSHSDSWTLDTSSPWTATVPAARVSASSASPTRA
jgi:hypothetical protein